jgi:uncharacterized membrane protein YcaP (DUF421 family)
MESYTDIILRSVVVYIFILAAIRLFGRKEFSQLTIIDLVFILLISNSVQNAMVGNNSTLLGGLVAAAALFVTNYVLKIFLYKDPKVSKWLQGEPVLLIHNGEILKKNLQQERITVEELELAAREHGVMSLKEVDLAIMEIDGNISIHSHNFQKHTRKKRVLQKALLKTN